MSRTMRVIRTANIYLALSILVGAALFPYLWVIVSSFKSTLEIFAMPPTILPVEATLENYRAALGITTGDAYTVSLLPQTFRNSLVTSSLATIFVVIVALPAGYGFARIAFPWRTPLLVLILGLRTVPGIVLVLPMYTVIQRLGLLDTSFSLLVVYAALQVPFATWLLSVFLQDIPEDLEDAARVDGCNRLGVLLRIMLPLALPSITVVAIFVFLNCWNDFLFALILTSTEAAKTMPVGLTELQTGYEIRWGAMMSGAVIHTIPTLLFIFFAQRYIVSGMTMGAMKG